MPPTPRLLVVDDSTPLRQVVRELASLVGYQFAGEAADGSAGVAAALRLAPDVVVMDWRMPQLDGVAATRMIHAKRPEIAVIAFSSSDADEIEAAFLDAGAVAYVDKSDTGGLITNLREQHHRALGAATHRTLAV